jgi:hypothetical protein
MMCEQISAHPNVTKFITVLEPVPLISPDLGLGESESVRLGLDFCVQLTDLEIDFHPGNIFNMPAQLNPPLGIQNFAIRAKVCAGVSCIPRELLETFTFVPPVFGTIGVLRRARKSYTQFARPLATPLVNNPFVYGTKKGQVSDYMVESTTILNPFPPIVVGPIVIVPQKMNCFCIEFFAKGHVDFTGPVGQQRIEMKIDDVEIVDIEPEGLENILECYIHLLIDRMIMPQVTTAASQFLFGTIDLGDVGEISISAASGVANNPSVEEDQVKTFVNLRTIDLTPIEARPGPGLGTVSRTTRSRSRAGPNDMTVAISESAFRNFFNIIRNNFTYSDSNSGSFGPFTAGYEVQFSLENGTVEFRNDNKIKITELDIKWDKLEANIGINIGEVCVGGQCIVPNPLNGCIVRLPEWCLFSANPDINLPLDLGGIFTSEISMAATPKVYYGVGSPNRWQVFMDPTLETDLDIVDIIGGIVEVLIEDQLNAIFSSLGLPGWAIDAILGMIGGITGVIGSVFEFIDDIGEGLADIIGVNLGLWNLIKAVVIDYFANQMPLAELEDPYPVLPADGAMIELTIPIEYLNVHVNTNEMVIEADLEDL